MATNSPDRDWERFAQTDPYFAVLTAPEYHGRPSAGARAKFFASGEAHIAQMWSIVRERLDPAFAPNRVLDFGCGVGRLLIPLAGRCGDVTGVDIAPSMLREARRNCDEAGAKGVHLVLSDGTLSAVTGKFDFVHSFIVLQHIAVDHGERLVEKLASLLVEGGVGMFHVSYDRGLPARNRFIYWMRAKLPGANSVLNVLRRRSMHTPLLYMNEYSLTRIIDILRRQGCSELHIRFSDHGGARGALVFARKSGASIFT